MVRVTEIQNNAKEIFKHIDLYGVDILLTELSKYPYMSHRPKTVPQEGSPTWTTKGSGKPRINNVISIICHRDGKTTIQTEKGFIQYWAAGQQVKGLNL